MTDERDPLDERRLLASAYLDDGLTPAERARTESDGEVMAEVEAMRTVRSRLADVPPPDAVRRDAAVAAALSAMAPAVRAPARPSAAARRRGRWVAPLAAAAAAVVIVVGGVLAVRSGGSDDDSADGGDAGSAATTGQAAGGADEVATTAGGAAATTAASGAAAPDAAAETTAAGADTSRAEATQGEATEETEATSTDGAFDDATPVVRDADDLRNTVSPPDEGASTTFATGAAPETTSARRCDLGRFVAVARYTPAGGPVTIVEIYVLEETGEIVAAAQDTCEVLLRATP